MFPFHPATYSLTYIFGICKQLDYFYFTYQVDEYNAFPNL